MVHTYKLQGYNIALDVNSGAVHVVDDLARDAIDWFLDGDQARLADRLARKYPAVDAQDIRETIGDVARLARDGQLYSADELEPIADMLKARQSTLKALCLHVAHDCNMACRYCFAA
ncbi:MAG: thioether cross-link-forming SCIFF peptide maturase, partial [Clostridiales bacterium]|nr:thioether cross-link-forming SCIFF peptide maturase [Clostridiales bacterium]